MKITKTVNTDIEVVVDVDLEDIISAIAEDPTRQHTVLEGINNFARFSKAVPVEIIEGIHEKTRKVIGDFLAEQSIRYSVAQTPAPCIWSVCERDPELMDTGCEELHLINVSSDKDFKFCPYCGKIRVLAE